MPFLGSIQWFLIWFIYAFFKYTFIPNLYLLSILAEIPICVIGFASGTSSDFSFRIIASMVAVICAVLWPFLYLYLWTKIIYSESFYFIFRVIKYEFLFSVSLIIIFFLWKSGLFDFLLKLPLILINSAFDIKRKKVQKEPSFKRIKNMTMSDSSEFQIESKNQEIPFPPKRDNDPFFYQRKMRQPWLTKKY